MEENLRLRPRSVPGCQGSSRRAVPGGRHEKVRLAAPEDSRTEDGCPVGWAGESGGFALHAEELARYIAEQYGADEEHLWASAPSYKVFRHQNNRKWFALIMDIPRCKLGLDGDEKIDILDLKCDPALIGSLRLEAGIFPAYHMNKGSWITVALDGSVEEETIKWLLDLSYQATAQKKRRK